MNNNLQDRHRLFYPLALCGIVFALFFRCLFFDFANYDDIALTIDNPLIKEISLQSLGRMFTFLSLDSYYPIRLLSLAVDRAVWGEAPMGYHLTNLIIHTANTLMVYGLALKLTSNKKALFPSEKRLFFAFCAALFFGVHPAVSDTVAWIPGREELLMLFFGILCLRLHMAACARPQNLIWHVLAAYACAFSCLSNVMGAVFPAIAAMHMLVMDRNPGLKNVLRSTWHLWIIGAAALFLKILGVLAWDDSSRMLLFPHVPSAIRYFPQILEAPALTYKVPVSLPEKIRTVLGVYGANFLHLVFPIKMPALYPPLAPKSFFSAHVIWGAAAAAGTGAALFFSRKNRLAVFGIMWFLISLFPSSQIMQHHISRADRFLYLPLVGFALVLCNGLVLLENRINKKAVRAFFFIFLAALTVRTIVHLPIWRNGMALHTHSIKSNPEYFLSHYFIAKEYKRQGEMEKAVKHYSLAIKYGEGEHYIWHPYLDALIQMGQKDLALSQALEAVRKRPDNAHLQNNLGIVYSTLEQSEKAVEHFQTAIKLMPRSPAVRENLAKEYSKMDKPRLAAREIREAIKINPWDANLHLYLANELERMGDVKGAIKQYREAMRCDTTLIGVEAHIGFLESGGPHQ